MEKESSSFRERWEISDPRWERDGLRQLTIRSAALGRRGDVTLHVPRGYTGNDAGRLPLVILLHGVYGSHWVWTSKAGVHETQQRLIDAGTIPPMLLAMPSDGLFQEGSAYVAHPDADYGSWIMDDVPRAIAAATDLIDPRAPVFLSGLSMGGFGAMHLGGLYPQRVAAVSAHSSLTQLSQLSLFTDAYPTAYPFAHDHAIAKTWAEARGPLPRLRVDCGKGDRLLLANRILHEDLELSGVEHSYFEFEGGHEWSYWQRHIADSLLFFAHSF